MTKIFIKLARPKRNIQCIAFTATTTLVAVMVAAGIPVKRHPIEPWQYVAPQASISNGKLWELLQDRRFKYIAVVTFLVSPLGSNQTFTYPGNWNSSNNKIETIAGGGSGGASTGQFTTISSSATGGGAGAYSAIANLVALPGSTATYQIGGGGSSASISGTNAISGNNGGDTWFNGATLGASSVGAKAGLAGVATNTANAQTGGAGGLAASGVGTTKRNGGSGGNTPVTAGGNYASSGGGGAGGPSGDGSTASTPGVNNASAGGAADNSTVTGGTAGGGTGGNGNSGTEFDGTHGCGSGGGGGIQIGGTATGGAGAKYGGGGGGAAGDSVANGISGNGGTGIIVVTNNVATRAVFAGIIG